MTSTKGESYAHFGDGGGTDGVTVADDSSSHEDDDQSSANHHNNGYTTGTTTASKHTTSNKMEPFEIIDHEHLTHYTQSSPSSHGEPKRLMYIWLRVILLTLYLVFTCIALYIVIHDRLPINNTVIDSLVTTTIIIPTVLNLFVYIRPTCMPRISFIVLCVILCLRSIQWLSALILLTEHWNYTTYLFAMLGACLNELGFLVVVVYDYYVFYLRRDYDHALLSVHYSSVRLVRILSALLLLSSMLWCVYTFRAFGDETQWIDTWFYLILTIFTAMFLVFECTLNAKWKNRCGFPACCIIMLYILFLWGDDELLSFSDVATASIIPQLLCLCFAYFKRFAAECM